MNQWRFIDDTTHTGQENMALDYALLSSVIACESAPVLRLYGWNSPTVTIGYFQSIDEETDRAQCRARHIDVIRRITGGGAVFHAAEITYSIVMPLDGSIVPANVNDSYTVLLSPIVDALRDNSIDAIHVPINDILSGGKKISGSAQIRRKGVLLQHGTIILDMDFSMAFSCLTVPASKNERHRIFNPEDRVTSLRKIIGDNAVSDLFIKSLRTSIADRFAACFNADLIPDNFTANEYASKSEAQRELFANTEWNESRKTRLGI